jgi:2-dehydropantoate 2-reductase
VRVVVFGAGAIGGLIGARLHQQGHDVTLVARGDHLRAIREHGLTVEAPDGATAAPIPATDDVATLELAPADVALLTTKSQHTAAAVDALAARSTEPSVACVQNGVQNERTALRRFANVYGVCVMCPASHLEPGVVRAHRGPIAGILDVGRYPAGVDDTAAALAAAFTRASFLSEPRPDIMRWKYTKLLLNLGNALEAACGPASRGSALAAKARAEGVACLDAAGIAYASEDEDTARRGAVVPRPPGRRSGGGPSRGGGSSWQSLQRHTGNVEADYLNGEIVLLGRLHGVPTPVNALLQWLANDLARRRAAPGSMTEAEVASLLP